MVRVLHFVSKMDRAGQETFLMNVYRNVNRDNIKFVFLCTSPQKGDYDDEIRQLGGEIYILPEVKKTGKFSKYFAKIKVLSKWLKENKDKFDIVHLHTYHAMDVWVHLEACRRAKVEKRIVHSHNTQGLQITLHKIMRQVCKFYDFKKFACSRAAGEWLFGKRAVKKGDVTVVYNGIDFAKYQYDSAVAKEYRQKLGVDDKIVLGHIGRFNYQKNHEFLIDVFSAFKKKYDDAVLLLVGRGELENKIKEKVNSLGLTDSVKFLGIRDDIPQLLNAMDVFVFPSLFEGLGIVLIEAEMCRLPIVTSDKVPEEVVINDAISLQGLGDENQWFFEIERMMQKDRKKIDFYASMNNFDVASVARSIEKDYMLM